MKLATIVIMISCLHLSAAVYSQNINISAKDMSLKTVFAELTDQSGYTFFYRTELVKPLKVSVDIKNATIDQAMEKCLQNTGLTYSIVESTVIIVPKAPAPVIAKASSAAVYVITGKVTDDKGQPMPGVTVGLKETNRRYATNNAGIYTAIVLDNDKTLVFSFIGYKTQEVALTGQKAINVVLKEDISHLDQVQVVAYGTTTKRLNTGDQTTVTAKEIEKYPVDNVLSVLQGTVNGMTVTQSTGRPGSTYKVNIRGRNGITTGSDPLYIIDGLPYVGGDFLSQNPTLGKDAYSGYDALSFINPLDIESVNVLKDADATAIYGSRGANGVILITTKKGKAGTTKVDLNVYSGISKITRLPDVLNTQQYLQMRREAKKNDSFPVLPGDYDINGTWDTTRYTNWTKVLLNGVGHTTNAQASISGGNDNTQYLISGNYRKQTNNQSLIGGSDQTASLHFNISNTSPNKKFYIGFTGTYTYDQNTIPSIDLTQNAVTLPPDAPVLFNPDGTLNYQNNTFINPLSGRNDLNSTTATNLMGSIILSYKLLTGLELKANLGYNRQQLNEFLGTPTTSYAPFQGVSQGQSHFTDNSNTSWSIEPQINYNTHVSKGELTATVGSSLQKQITESNALSAIGYSSDLLLRSITAGTTIAPISGIPYDYEKYKFSALFGRVNYNWDGKYLLNLSGRYDGSSKFGEDRRFHFFSAAGAAWIFSKEDFFKSLPFISFGKLRVSYGSTGNDQIPNNRYLELYNSTRFPYQGIPGLYPSNLPNPDFSWETTTKAEAGIELHFLHDRISVESNFYRNHTSDILTGNPLSTITGFNNVIQNLPASIVNKGFDITLNTVNIQNNDFIWSTTFLFTRQRNKLLKFPGALTPATERLLNQPVGITNVFKFAGVNPQTGVYQFYDKDGKITDNPVPGIDDNKLIDLNPDFFGAVKNSFEYKGFTLDFLFRYIKQTGLNAFGQSAALTPPGLAAANDLINILPRWQKPGDVTSIQRYTSSFALYQPYLNARKSDQGYGDASYIRLQNLSFGYRFQEPVLRRLHLQGLRVYVQGENLLTISKYGNLDPENQSGYKMPPLRIFTTGLQVTL